MSKENMTPNLIPPHGGYRELKSYQMAEIIYDATVVFCNRFIDMRLWITLSSLSELLRAEGVVPTALPDAVTGKRAVEKAMSGL